MLLRSPLVGGLAQRLGSRVLMLIGPLLCAVGLALLTRIEPRWELRGLRPWRDWGGWPWSFETGR